MVTLYRQRIPSSERSRWVEPWERDGEEDLKRDVVDPDGGGCIE